jgi:paraquat-inducible protein A
VTLRSKAPDSHWLACRLCRASIRDRDLRRGEELRCARCSELVKKADGGASPQAALALAITGLFLVALANAFPILAFDVAGNTQSNRIVTGVFALRDQGYASIAALVFFCAIAAPALHFAAVAYVALAGCAGVALPGVRRAAHAAEILESWSLAPVFAIACVVAVVKLDMLGSVAWESGIAWIALLALCSLALGQVFDREAIEEMLEGKIA